MRGQRMMSTSHEPLATTFIIPTGLPGPSGGSRYNKALIRALEAAGCSVSVCGVPGPWPRPEARDLERLRAALAGREQVVVDGLIASSAPDEIQAAAASGTRVHVLFHLSLLVDGAVPPAGSGRAAALERRALQSAHTVICTSNWAARDVVNRYGPLPTRVVSPGTDQAPLAVGSAPPQLLLLASVTPRKNQLAILRALAALTELDWQALLVGPDAADPDYAQRVRLFAEAAFPPGRVQVLGSRTGPGLERIWSASDLLLLVSRAEPFGMVVTEAVARGIPAIVGAGTGAEEALALGPHAPPGIAVAPDDTAALEEVLRGWLSDPAQRAAWRRSAEGARGMLPTWDDSADLMLRILTP